MGRETVLALAAITRSCLVSVRWRDYGGFKQGLDVMKFCFKNNHFGAHMEDQLPTETSCKILKLYPQ